MSIESTIADLLSWLDEGRKLFDGAAALGVVPEAAIVAPIVDGLDDLADLARKLQAGTLSVIQTEVQAADAAAKAAEDEKFPGT